MSSRRIGRFIVPTSLVEGFCRGEGLNVFAGGAVVDVRHDWMRGQVEYFMYHPTFTPVKLGDLIPLYVAEIGPYSSSPTWRKKPEVQR
jgi:hypothetical protein